MHPALMAFDTILPSTKTVIEVETSGRQGGAHPIRLVRVLLHSTAVSGLRAGSLIGTRWEAETYHKEVAVPCS